MLLISVLVVSIFTLFFAASISYKQIKSLNASAERILQSYKVNLELGQLKSFAKEAESNQRGYLLTKDTTFLLAYLAAIEKAKNSIKELKALTSNFQQSKTLDSISYLMQQRFDFLAKVIRSNSFHPEISNTTKNMLFLGKNLMELALTQIDKMIINEMQLLKDREIDHYKHIKFSPFSILFVVFLALSVFVIAYSKINRDLKSLTRTNNQLLINKQIFEHSEHIANISNWRWNKEENKLNFSNNLYHLIGCKPNECATDKLIEFVHPDDRQFVFESSQSAFQELVGSVIFFRIIRKDGALRYIKSSWKAITDNYGKTFVIGVNADITEQYNKDKMIEDKIADLEKSNKELSAFNHVASHDLQEPLRKVQTFISRIREKNYESFPEQVKDYFSGIERATSRMQMFIEDLLLYSRASNVARIFEMT
ncbi:MAG TPA: CHASE3 domain-containing protein, partial [Prolixibacteraceae bacterium]|nr:CHASE3 domain-containing protein [Prolixibacteraceae bacterium]